MEWEFSSLILTIAKKYKIIFYIDREKNYKNIETNQTLNSGNPHNQSSTKYIPEHKKLKKVEKRSKINNYWKNQ